MTYRTHWCGEIGEQTVGRRVSVAGWVHRRRDHGGLVFIDLRDRSALVQLVFDPEQHPVAHAAAHDLRGEYVIAATGQVVARGADQGNPRLATGSVEIHVDELTVLAESKTLGLCQHGEFIHVDLHRPGRQSRIDLVRAAGDDLSGSCDHVLSTQVMGCLLYTSDAADDLTRVALGGRRII